LPRVTVRSTVAAYTALQASAPGRGMAMREGGS